MEFRKLLTDNRGASETEKLQLILNHYRNKFNITSKEEELQEVTNRVNELPWNLPELKNREEETENQIKVINKNLCDKKRELSSLNRRQQKISDEKQELEKVIDSLLSILYCAEEQPYASDISNEEDQKKLLVLQYAENMLADRQSLDSIRKYIEQSYPENAGGWPKEIQEWHNNAYTTMNASNASDSTNLFPRLNSQTTHTQQSSDHSVNQTVQEEKLAIESKNEEDEILQEDKLLLRNGESPKAISNLIESRFGNTVPLQIDEWFNNVLILDSDRTIPSEEEIFHTGDLAEKINFD